MGNYLGVHVLYALGSQVGIVFYIWVSHLCDHIWLSFSPSQLIWGFFSGYSSFPPSPKLTSSQKHLAWVLCSGIMHDHLAAARGTFDMHSAHPIWAVPFTIQPLGLQLRVISRTLLLFLSAWSKKRLCFLPIRIPWCMVISVPQWVLEIRFRLTSTPSHPDYTSSRTPDWTASLRVCILGYWFVKGSDSITEVWNISTISAISVCAHGWGRQDKPSQLLTCWLVPQKSSW